MAPGTYGEQDVVDGTHGASGLTITAANGAGTVTVDAPTTLQETALSPTSGNPIDGIFTVDGVSNVTISNIALDGLGYGDGAHFALNQPGTGSEGPSLIGIAYIDATGGAISGDTIANTDENDGGFGDQRNFGIFVVNNTTLAGDIPTQGEASTLNTITIANSTLSGFQKGGIVVEYADATISGNTLTGAGDVNTAQNAIEVRESTGTVSDNIIRAIGYSGTTAAATGVLGFDNYGLDIIGNTFTGALDSNGHLLVSPVGYYVLDSTNGEIENNSAANVDNGVVVYSDAFGDDITGVWTVTGNTTTNVVPAADGGGSLYFDPEPTTSGSSFVASGSAGDVGDVFFVSAGTDTLTGGSGGGNSFVVVNGSDLSNADTIDGNSSSVNVNVIDFASGTPGDTLTIGSNVTDVQEVDVVGSTYAQTDTTPLNVNIAAAPSVLTVVANDGGDIITGNAGNDTLTGGTGNDTFNVGAGSNTVTGGGGHDTVHYDAALTATDITVASSTTWQVSEAGDGTDTLTGVQDVTDGTHNFLLVGDGAYSDVTAASAAGAASSGDTLIVDSGSDPSPQTVGTDGLTIDALASSTALTLQLGSAVTTVTLADYDTVNHLGANITVTANSAGDTITGNDGSDTLTGGTGNDTFILGAGTNSVTGGGGVDTVEVGAGYQIAIQNGDQWVLTNSTTHVTDTLSGIDKVDIAGTTYDLVDKFGAAGGFQSLQAAIDASHSGDTILVAPGTYTESANYNAAGGAYGSDSGTNPMGLLVDQSNLTIEGVDGSGAVITSASDTLATIVSSVESNFGTNFYITAPDVTITGLTFQASDLEAGQHQGSVNKAIEVVANGFTLENSLVDAASGVPLGSSVYVDELTVPNSLSGYVADISSFDIAHNILTGDFVEASGVGYGDGLSEGAPTLLLASNEFSLNAGTTTADYGGNIGVILDGQLDAPPLSIAWDLAPVVAPDVTGNTFDADYTADPYGARFLAWDDSASNLPDATYVANYVTDNTLGTYAYALTSGGGLDYSTYQGSSYYYIYLNAGDASAAANPGDTLVVDSGSDSSVQTITTNDLTVDATADSSALTLQLGTDANSNPVTTITLADYSAGHGANITVTGNAAGDTITGNDGNDTLTGGTGNDTFILGAGTNSVTGGGGVDTVEVGAGYHIAIQSGQWVVTNGAVTDTLSGIDKVDIAGTTYDLVDKFGAAGGFQSLQAAIDSAGNGDKILVAPGTYTESANYDPVTGLDDTTNGSNPVGLLVDKSVTIEGVDGSGNVITSASSTQATIVSSIESDWGTNFYITAPNVTITGLNFQGTDLEYGQTPENQGAINKDIEIVANNVTLADDYVGAASGVVVGSSVYVDELTVPSSLAGYVADISSYDITHNVLTGDFVEASGVGDGDATTDLQLTGNTFALNTGTTLADYVTEDGGYSNDVVILNGDLTSIGVNWDLAPVVAPDVSGNTVEPSYTSAATGGALFLVWDSSSSPYLPDATYVADYIANNIANNPNGEQDYAYALKSDGSLDYSTQGGTSYYFIYVGTGEATAAGAANPGDTIVVQSDGDTSVQTIGTNDLTIDALAGSNGLNLLLGSGVTEITLADYAHGLGANVNVTGNGEGDTIIGNSGNNVIDPGDASGPSTLTGGGGNDTFVYGAGYGAVTITDFDQGSGSFVQGEDTINLIEETNVNSFSALQNDATFTNGDTLLSFGNGDVLTLDGVNQSDFSQLTAGDFTFAASPAEQFTWQNSAGGDWESSNWSNSGYPGSSDDAVIGVAGSYIVTVDNNDAVNNLSIANSHATLEVLSDSTSSGAIGSLDVKGSLDNAGTIVVQGAYESSSQTSATASSATFEGAVTNTGHIIVGGFSVTLGNSGSATTAAPTLTFEGTVINTGGHITVSSSSAALVLSNATVEGGTIVNTGTIYGDNSTIDDGATISGGTLVIDIGNTLTFGSGTSDTDDTIAGVTVLDRGTLAVAGGETSDIRERRQFRQQRRGSVGPDRQFRNHRGRERRDPVPLRGRNQRCRHDHGRQWGKACGRRANTGQWLE